MAKELWTTALFFLPREIYKSYYEKQLAQMEERSTGLKSRINANKDAEIEHNPHCFFSFLFFRKEIS